MCSRSSFFAIALAAVVALPAAAQPVEVSRLEADKAQDASLSPAVTAPNYITDVSGKKVRLVGPRFYPDSARMLEFPGRRINPATSSGGDALSLR